MTILDATAADVKALDDVQLRRLVAKLAAAELRALGLPETGVGDGGDQSAKDGGVDVYVDGDPTRTGGVLPRLPVGIQVKATPMRRAAIGNEMRPKGVLREAIQRLARLGGAYVIAAGRDDLSASALLQAQRHMRDALNGEADLAVEFLDASRLARWASQYPGVTRWLLAASGRPTGGWRGLDGWSTPNEAARPYIVDEHARLRVGGETEDAVETVAGLEALRNTLRVEGAVARLVGLSGMGKTRLAEALFDHAIGEGALAAELAVYGDAGANPEVSPAAFAEQLTDSGRPAVLIVDNCPAGLHRALAAVVRRPGSRVALLTIDFDIGPDQPEHTQVFRLEPAGDLLVDHLLRQRRPDLAYGDRGRIVAFSEGNTRIALVLARTAKTAGDLTGLSDPELLDRLFLNARRGADSDLRAAAGAASLVYAFETTPPGDGSEAAWLAELAGLRTLAFHRKVGDLLERGMAQQRGVQRAVLPPAVAGWLAEETLAKFPPEVIVDHMAVRGPRRLRRSFVRRLSILSSSRSVRAVASRLLAADGPLAAPTDVFGDDMAMVRDLARHAGPEALAIVEHTLDRLTPEKAAGSGFLPRNALVQTLQVLAQDPTLFSRAVDLMAQLACAEASEGADRVRPRLLQFFQMSHSGVDARPSARLQIMAGWLAHSDPARAKLGLQALETALTFSPRHYFPLDENGLPQASRGSLFDTTDAVTDWLRSSLEMLVDAAQGAQKDEARAVFLRRFDALARREFSIGLALEYFPRFEATGPWREAWFGVCRALSRSSPTERPSDLEALERRLRPVTLEARFDTWLYSDWHRWRNPAGAGADDWREAQQSAVQVGIDAVTDEASDGLVRRAVFDLHAAGRAFGEGFALGHAEKALGWERLVQTIHGGPDQPVNWTTLGGYIDETAKTAPDLAESWIEDLFHAPGLLEAGFCIVASRSRHDDRDLQRMLTAMRATDAPGVIDRVWWGRPADEASDDLVAEMVDELLRRRRPHDAYRLLDTRLNRDRGAAWSGTLAATGRRLIAFLGEPEDEGADDGADLSLRDYQLARLTARAATGPAGIDAAHHILSWIRRRALDTDDWLQGLPETMALLSSRYPTEVLDALLLAKVDHDGRYRLDHILHPLLIDDEEAAGTPILGAPLQAVLAWLEVDPDGRGPLLASVIPFLRVQPESPPAWTPAALALLDRCAGEQVLDTLRRRLLSGSGSGSAAERYRARRPMIVSLADHSDPRVRAWSQEIALDLDDMVLSLERYERERDQRFE